MHEQDMNAKKCDKMSAHGCLCIDLYQICMIVYYYSISLDLRFQKDPTFCSWGIFKLTLRFGYFLIFIVFSKTLNIYKNIPYIKMSGCNWNYGTYLSLYSALQ